MNGCLKSLKQRIGTSIFNNKMKHLQDDKEIFVHGHSLSRDIRDVTSVDMMVYLRREKWKDRSRQFVHIRTD